MIGEIFHSADRPDLTLEPGFYFWFRSSPGSRLPNSKPVGPYAAAEDAWLAGCEAAAGGAGLTMCETYG